MAYDLEAKFYREILESKLTETQKQRLEEVNKNPDGNATVIIRSDPNRMTQRRNEVKRKYDKRRDWRR